jgi:2-hydroxy-3-keto-5-methylthiopentenyl-1-phosphate phosphatase
MPRAVEPLSCRDLILCDFDGTISVEDTGIAVINALKLEAAWEMEHVWRRGEISSMECLASQWAMVKLPQGDLLDLLDSFALRTDFVPFWALVQQRQAAFAVVSDGLDFYIDRMMARLGLATCPGEEWVKGLLAAARQGRRPPVSNCVPRFANRTTLDEEGVHVEFPHRTPVCAQCGNCKLHHLFELRPYFERVIYIGDGHSDMCPAKYADVLFARSHLAEDAANRGMPFIPFEAFADVMAILG